MIPYGNADLGKRDILGAIASVYHRMVATGITTGNEALYMSPQVKEILFPIMDFMIINDISLDIITEGYTYDYVIGDKGKVFSNIYMVDKGNVAEQGLPMFSHA